MKWLNGEGFIRAKVSMTKETIRVLSVSYLDLEEDLSSLDIGSGTGGISVQAALLGAHATAIERREEGVHLLKGNTKRHGAEVKAVHGLAPKDLPDQNFDRVFIGGNAGDLEETFSYLDKHLKKSEILIRSCITLKNIREMYELLKKHSYRDTGVGLVQATKLDHLGLMKGENPIYIMEGVKE